MPNPLLLAAYAASKLYKANKDRQREIDDEKRLEEKNAPKFIQIGGGTISPDSPEFNQLAGQGMIMIQAGNQFQKYTPTKPLPKQVPIYRQKIGNNFITGSEDEIIQKSKGTSVFGTDVNLLPNDWKNSATVLGYRTISQDGKISYEKNPFVEEVSDPEVNWITGPNKETGDMIIAPNMAAYKNAGGDLTSAVRRSAKKQDAMSSGLDEKQFTVGKADPIKPEKADTVDTAMWTYELNNEVGFSKTKSGVPEEAQNVNFEKVKIVDGKPTRTGELVKGAATTDLPTEMVDVLIDGEIKSVPLAEYNKDPSMGDLQRTTDGKKAVYITNKSTGARTYSEADVAGGQLSKLAAASNAAKNVSLFSYTYKGNDGKDETFTLTKDDFSGDPKPKATLQYVRNLLETGNLPRIEGTNNIDWSKQSAVETERLAANVARLIAEDAHTIDKNTGAKVGPSPDMATNLIDFVATKYPTLGQIPGVQQELKYQFFDNERKVQEKAILKGQALQDGTPLASAQVKVPVDVPLSAYDDELDVSGLTKTTVKNSTFLNYRFDKKYQEPLQAFADALSTDGKKVDLTNVPPEMATKLGDFVEYEKDRNGKILKDADGSNIPAKTNRKMELISKLLNTQAAGGGNLLASMFQYAQDKKLPEADKEQIEEYLGDYVGEDYLTFRKVVTPFMDSSLSERSLRPAALYDRALKARFGEKSFQDFKKDAAGKAGSGERTRVLMDSMIGTFFADNDRTQPYKINTFIGTRFYLPYVGLRSMIQAGAEKISILGKVSEVAKVTSTVIDDVAHGENGYTSFLDTASPEQIAEEAKRRSMTVDAFMEAERAARAYNREKFAAIKTKLDTAGDNGFARNLALRNFYRYMVAYSLSATIQGGTGGRTISDQDVKLMLDALSAGNALAIPENEIAVLEAARDMASEISLINGDISSGNPSKAMSAMLFQKYSRESMAGNITAFAVAGKLRDVNRDYVPPAGSIEAAQVGEPTQDELEQVKMKLMAIGLSGAENIKTAEDVVELLQSRDELNRYIISIRKQSSNIVQ
jgi:hypothetical protein